MPDRRRPTAEDFARYDAHLAKIIGEAGWAIQGVGAGATLPLVNGKIPQFAYTVGLSMFDHPELITVGLSFEVMQSLLNNAGKLVEKGQQLEPGKRYEDILDPSSGLTVGFRRCSNEQLNSAKSFFGPKIPALQLLWPDTQNHLPGEPGFEDRFVLAQPLWPPP